MDWQKSQNGNEFKSDVIKRLFNSPVFRRRVMTYGKEASDADDSHLQQAELDPRTSTEGEYRNGVAANVDEPYPLD